MKKMMLFFALLLLPFAMLMAQDLEPPSDIFDAVGNFKEFMATLGGVVVLSVFLTGFINGLFKVLNSNVRLIISWITPIALTLLAGLLLHVGFLAESPWW